MSQKAFLILIYNSQSEIVKALCQAFVKMAGFDNKNEPREKIQ